MDAKLSLAKDPESVDIEETDEEPRTFAELLPGLAIAAGYVAVGLVLLLALNIAVGLLVMLHGLHLYTWIMLVIYSGLGGAFYRLLKERERAAKALALQWGSYRAWATDDLPEIWEKTTAVGRTVRGWVWETTS